RVRDLHLERHRRGRSSRLSPSANASRPLVSPSEVRSPLLEHERRVVLREKQVVVSLLEVQALRGEGGELLVAVGGPHRLLHIRLVEGSVLIRDATVAEL